MSSSSTDDYAGLTAPWKPISSMSIQYLLNARPNVQSDDGVKVSSLLSVT